MVPFHQFESQFTLLVAVILGLKLMYACHGSGDESVIIIIIIIVSFYLTNKICLMILYYYSFVFSLYKLGIIIKLSERTVIEDSLCIERENNKRRKAARNY